MVVGRLLETRRVDLGRASGFFGHRDPNTEAERPREGESEERSLAPTVTDGDRGAVQVLFGDGNAASPPNLTPGRPDPCQALSTISRPPWGVRSLAKGGGVIAVAVAALCAGCSHGAAPGVDPAPPAAAPMYASVRPDSDARVLMIGIDGADWEIVDRLAASGRLPVLDRLRREGAAGVLLSEEPLLSPIVWTTIATGRSPADHGIFGFLTRRGGRTEPVRSDERRLRAFWNILTDMGVPAGAIGWYASWPAEPVNGFVVSDRAGSHQIAGTALPERSGLTWPPSLDVEVRRLDREVAGAITTDTVAARYCAPGQGAGLPEAGRSRLEQMTALARTAELYRHLADGLIARFDPRIAGVYFELTDAAGHLFAGFAPPALPGSDPAEARCFGGAFDRAWEEQDRILGELLARVDPARTLVLIVSDHGFRTGARRPAVPSSEAGANQAPLWHRPEGLILMWGRGVAPGTSLQGARINDVLPTALRALGLPSAGTLQGRALESAFRPGALPPPAARVADFETAGPRPRVEAAPIEASEEIEKLQALGYVGGAAATAAGGAGEGQEAIPLNRYNRGIVLLQAGRNDEALDVFRALQGAAPDLPQGWVGEGFTHLQANRPADAIAPLEKAIAMDERVAGVNATLGEAYLRAGRPAEAAAALQRALARDPAQPRAAMMLGEIEMGRKRFEPARAAFEAARTSGSGALRAAACTGLAILSEDARDLAAARRYYEEAMQAAPDYPPTLERFANLDLYEGRFDEAAALLDRLAAAQPANAKVVSLQAQALAGAGRRDQAIAAARRALAMDPADARARHVLAALGATAGPGG